MAYQGRRKRELIENCFRSILGRAPTSTELKVSLPAFDELLTEAKKDSKANAIQSATRHLVHVLLNHNDFIGIR